MELCCAPRLQAEHHQQLKPVKNQLLLLDGVVCHPQPILTSVSGSTVENYSGKRKKTITTLFS